MIIVSDTSPIRALAHLANLDLLRTLFREVLVPPTVASELERPRSKLPPIPLNPYPFIRIQPPSATPALANLRVDLHAGEAEAIALAIELQADFVLVDELAGRSLAQRHGLQPLGTIGVLLRGKEAGLLSAIKPLIERLETELGFFVSASLRQRALASAGE